MLPTSQIPEPRCDCCGAPIHLQAGDFCPRCGYPVSMPKEEHFLEESIRNLQRIATYGGAQATVTNLLQRYQVRLSVIRWHLYAAPTRQSVPSIPRSEVVLSSSIERPVAPIYANNQLLPTTDMPRVSTGYASVVPLIQPVQMATAPVASAPQQMFSLRSFFADQTLNIVSSLGAFLILIGSLSFVVTTTNLFLSFLVLFLVHLIFAIVGFVFHRFPSFRFISRIYTAIFALLIPLVEFSGCRLVAGRLIQLSAPTVVAIAATYAAIVYATLAISQQYKPFGYLAAVAFVLAALAVALVWQLNYWWWPILLMPLAFIALLSVSKAGSVFYGNSAILREPTRVLMYTCIAVLCLDILCIYSYALAIEALDRSFLELRVAGTVMLLLALAWTCTYFWVTKQRTWLAVVPYQLLGLAVAFTYVFEVRAVSYGLLFTAVAVCYHIATLIARNPLPRFQQVRNHMEGIALVLVALVPLLVAPLVPLNLLEIVYSGHDIQFPLNGNTFFVLIALTGSCVLTVSIMLSHTGLQRILARPHTAWCWLLLLDGLLFTWMYSIIVLSLHIAFVYEFLALTLVLLLGTIIVRRFISTSWSNPLDVLVLGEAALTLLLYLNYGTDASLALLFLFALLSYSIVVYQRRHIWLFIPMICMALAFPALVERPRIMLLLSVGLPLVALVFAKVEQHKRGIADTVTGSSKITLSSLFSWEWPLLVSGFFYGIVVCNDDALAPMSTLQNWLGVSFSVALEMAGLALLWYIVAALTRRQWMLLVTISFAIGSLLVSPHSLWILACVAGVTALLAVGVGRMVAKIWAIPLYVTALAAAVLTGVYGMLGDINAPFPTAIPDTLLLYALVAYVVLIMERRRELLILPISLVLWGIVQTQWEPWQQMGALSILFFLVFVMLYIWHLLPTQAQGSSQGMWYTLLSFVGQVGILLVIIGQGGLSPDAGALAHVGISVLLLLAVQLFCYGWVQQEKHYWTMYTAGLLVALAIPWELSTFQITRIEWLTLVPATYLIVIAPFLSHNERVVQHQRTGQLCSILGASLLLLPTLWSSFSEPNIQPTFVLAGEALALLLLGVTLRTRFLVLSGAGLVIVSAMHALFLPSLGLPPSLALTIMGVTLLALATALSLARHRLQTVWAHLD